MPLYPFRAAGVYSSTQKYQVLFKNRNVVTVDGTRSFDNTAVGPSTLYDANGTVLLQSHGPSRVHLVIDLASDTVISQEVTFEHGAHDGYCETLSAALGV